MSFFRSKEELADRKGRPLSAPILEGDTKEAEDCYGRNENKDSRRAAGRVS